MEELKKRLSELRGFLDTETLSARAREIEALAGAPDFWADQGQARALMAELAAIREKLDLFGRLESEVETLDELIKENPTAVQELSAEIETIEKDLDELELRLVLSDPDDLKNAILSIHPGAGGTESQDWAQMLLRMYLRWAEREGYGVKTLDYQPGDEAGIKDAVILVEGPYAYGYLKAERGVHRLVRISPFDAAHRRHTSFASVFVYPEVEEVEVELDMNDVRIETFRASGPGGQHMQKNDTAVRVIHEPTGIVVSCQSERSQHQNKINALRILRARLYEAEREAQKEAMKAKTGEKHEIGWGHQIRSYVLHPYRMVKDHRTGHETGNTDAVLDGEITEFMRKYLLSLGRQAK
ncbi:MAG: peptide chain release factor 2 [Candidatus Hydrothermia bacterium]